jgi:uncharacterized protein
VKLEGKGGKLLDTGEEFDYQAIVQDALRDAVRRVLATVAERGLPGAHYFYIGFRTDEPGVEMPRGLREQYPHEMTVILQNQYWNLEVEAESFSVSLSFNGVRERLTVPFAALTAFVDPSAEFGLRFDGEDGRDAAPAGPRRVDSATDSGAEPAPESPPEHPAAADEPPDEPEEEKGGEVVPFDPRRKR